MKEFVEYLFKQIATHTDDVVVSEIESEGMTVFDVTVNPEDMPKVIGKAGRNIKSIRNLCRAKAIKDNVRVQLNLIDPLQKPDEV